MKKSVFVLSMVLSVLLAGSALAGNGRGMGPPGGNQPPPDLTLQEELDLLYIREEEKLAHDVYVMLYATWGMPIFDKISLSELSHMDAMLKMLILYDMDDPAFGKGVGEFTDPGIGQLYIELMKKGLWSKQDALEVGVMIETMDISDLQLAITNTTQDPLINSYGKLLEGSRRHLEAFEKSIAALDGAEPSAILGLNHLKRLRSRYSGDQP